MKFLSKVIGVFLVIFAVAFYQAEPTQKRHHPHSYKIHHRGNHKMKFKRVAYHKAPRHYYKKHYYRPARPYRHYTHKRYRQPRVYHSRPVVVVNL